MAARVPERFSMTESAVRVIRSLTAHPNHVAYICWVRQEAVATGGSDFEGWSVVAYEERECDEPVEMSGIRFVFDPYRKDELIGKTLDWIDGYGFRVT
jgi:hypothetical protein